MNTDTWITCRRAVEGLRAGVPNRDTVRALGCDQLAADRAFQDQLQRCVDLAKEGKQCQGVLISGDFGAGKSHTLEYFRHLALERRFVCSKVVVSKETPIYDPLKLYRAAVQTATMPDKTGDVIGEIVTRLGLQPPDRAYYELLAWTREPGSGLNSRFAATLFLLKHLSNAHEDIDRIIRFWSGETIQTGDLRKLLKPYKSQASFPLEPVSQRELAIQRFHFLPRVMAAAGYSGWVLLIDELELIGRYSPLQRARSYAEVARWAGKSKEEQFPFLLTVCAVTELFKSEVLEETGKNDLDTLPQKLRDKGRDPLAREAESGMKYLQEEAVPLRRPTPDRIRRSLNSVRDLYAKAYDWSPPAQAPEIQAASATMRTYIKSWINQWDLKRLYNYDGESRVRAQETRQSFTEDFDLERSEQDGDTPV